MEKTVAEPQAAWQSLMTIALCREKLLMNLKELAEQQRRMLVEGRHAALADNIQAQDQSLAELACLDQQEDTLMRELPADQMESHPSRRSQLMVLAAKSAQTAEQLRLVVRGNRELFENAMQYVAFSLGALSTMAVDEPSYNPNSGSPVNSAALMLDLKV